MFLDAVKAVPVAAQPATTSPKKSVDLDAALAQWVAPPLSQIAHHGGRCCDAARSWLLGMDVANRGTTHALTGPRWIRGMYKWGPSHWPIHWCEAVRQKTLDCGVLAWMTREVMRARGLSCYLAQTVQHYSEDTTAHWAAAWKAAGEAPRWIRGPLVYHELCAVVLPDGAVRLWDPSSGWWLEEGVTIGYGSLAALRIVDGEGELASTALHWSGQHVSANTWQVLKAD